MPALHLSKHPEAKRLTALLALLVIISACSLGSSRDSSLDSILPFSSDSDDGLRKRIGVAPFELRTQHTDAYSRELMQLYLLQAIRNECPGIEFIKPVDENYPPVLRDLPRLESGDLDNLQAAIAGRQLGLNAVMVGTLTSVGTEEKERGFWLMRRNRYYVQVQVLVEI